MTVPYGTITRDIYRKTTANVARKEIRKKLKEYVESGSTINEAIRQTRSDLHDQRTTRLKNGYDPMEELETLVE